VDLGAIDPARTPGLSGDGDAERARAEGELREHTQRIAAMQERLYAEGSRAMLVVLQGMDCSGKDGVIRHVFGPVNPQGCRVVSFKRPSDEELSHDFLWRVHARVPRRGEIGVFNRSHYEDVLIVRVHGTIDDREARSRIDRIARFEEHLAASGTTVLKFFLHISKGEQRSRLLDRLREPDKRWKWNDGDLAERKSWDRYMRAYEDAIAGTSLAHAPWHVIPADKKWYRNWAVASIVREALDAMDPKPPRMDLDPDSVRIE
jgi:PPK2 family polyphosphate:nucleotide phosphotransferase